MRKLFSNKKVENTYEALQKRRKFIKRRSILLALFVLGINVFAWFIYITSADMSYSANVVSWDVTFFDENEEIHDAVISISDMYPGMDTFQKNIRVTNSSDVKATYTYRIIEASIFGNDVLIANDDDATINRFKNEYPFSIYFVASKTVLEKNDTLDFQVLADWEYESATTKYFKLNNYFKFDPSIKYYQLNGSTYTAVNVTESTYSSLASSLYVEKDDADSLYGSSCKEYRANTGKPCVEFKLEMKVTQLNA